MSEITPPHQDIQSQDSRVTRSAAASDQNASNQQPAEQKTKKQNQDGEIERITSHHEPAVTLASTLAKLDSGSNFTAHVQGSDGDGRTIISSELGTYLVEHEQKYAEEFKKIPQNSNDRRLSLSH